MLTPIYTLILYIIQPLVILRLFIRARKTPAYKERIAERYGFFDIDNTQPSIWVHSVSVGETIASAPMVKQIIKQYPDYRIVVTTMTPTGSEQVVRLYNNDVFHVYAPYDLPFAIRRFLKKTTPKLAIFMETELWPNTIRLCYKKKIPVMIANARLSARSTNGYHRFNKNGFVSRMFSRIHTLAAQHSDDAERFVSLGLPRKALHITGSLKYDVLLPENTEAVGRTLKSQWLERKPPETKIIIAASTHKGEERLLLKAFKNINASFENVLFVIVPRHPDRFNDVAMLCKEEGYLVSRKSLGEPVVKETAIVLADTMGELPLLLAACDIVFMGGSLVPVGGHNFMESAMLGLPQITGPYVFNFQHVADKLKKAGGLLIDKKIKGVECSLKRLLTDPDECKRIGKAAKNAMKEEQGALNKHLELIKNILRVY